MYTIYFFFALNIFYYIIIIKMFTTKYQNIINYYQAYINKIKTIKNTEIDNLKNNLKKQIKFTQFLENYYLENIKQLNKEIKEVKLSKTAWNSYLDTIIVSNKIFNNNTQIEVKLIEPFKQIEDKQIEDKQIEDKQIEEV